MIRAGTRGVPQRDGIDIERQRREMIGTDFITIELELADTFCKLALNSHSAERKAGSNAHQAHRALERGDAYPDQSAPERQRGGGCGADRGGGGAAGGAGGKRERASEVLNRGRGAEFLAARTPPFDQISQARIWRIGAPAIRGQTPGPRKRSGRPGLQKALRPRLSCARVCRFSGCGRCVPGSCARRRG